MKTVTVNNWGAGMASDKYSNSAGEFSASRNFDTITYPQKLFPMASMASDTSGTGIGNIIVGTDGIPYGIGVNGSGGVELYNNPSGSSWVALTSSQITGDPAPSYNLFVEYKRIGANSSAPDNSAGAKFLVWGTLNTTYTILCSNPNDVGNPGVSNVVAAISGITALGQGFVHPKDQVLYIPYKTSTHTYIGTYNGTTWTAGVFELPIQYTITSMTNYGDFLAIACSVANPTNNSSIVYLWDRDTSNSLPNESITWGEDYLQVLNNLNGTLIGISTYSSDDDKTLVAKGWAGGAVEILRTIPAVKQTTTSPTVTIYPRVNIIHRNRLYFSADVKGGSTSPTQQGIWSVGKNRNGQWSMGVERFASTDGSDVSVIAAAFKLDYLYCCHTTEGTLTFNAALSSTLSTRFASASYLESLVNPGMPDSDKPHKKKFFAVAIHTAPLTSSGQVVLKYRIDSDGSWTTLLTKTSSSPDTDLTAYETPVSITGRNIEFRIESTGGAQIIGWSYKFSNLETSI